MLFHKVLTLTTLLIIFKTAFASYNQVIKHGKFIFMIDYRKILVGSDYILIGNQLKRICDHQTIYFKLLCRHKDIFYDEISSIDLFANPKPFIILSFVKTQSYSSVICYIPLEQINPKLNDHIKSCFAGDSKVTNFINGIPQPCVRRAYVECKEHINISYPQPFSTYIYLEQKEIFTYILTKLKPGFFNKPIIYVSTASRKLQIFYNHILIQSKTFAVFLGHNDFEVHNFTIVHIVKTSENLLIIDKCTLIMSPIRCMLHVFYHCMWCNMKCYDYDFRSRLPNCDSNSTPLKLKYSGAKNGSVDGGSKIKIQGFNKINQEPLILVGEGVCLAVLFNSNYIECTTPSSYELEKVGITILASSVPTFGYVEANLISNFQYYMQPEFEYFEIVIDFVEPLTLPVNFGTNVIINGNNLLLGLSQQVYFSSRPCIITRISNQVINCVLYALGGTTPSEENYILIDEGKHYISQKFFNYSEELVVTPEIIKVFNSDDLIFTINGTGLKQLYLPMIGYLEANRMYEKTCQYSNIQQVLKCPVPVYIKPKKVIIEKKFFIFSKLNLEFISVFDQTWSVMFKAIIFPQPKLKPLSQDKLEVIDGEAQVEIPSQLVFEGSGIVVELSVGQEVLKCGNINISEDKIECSFKVYNANLLNSIGRLSAKFDNNVLDLGNITLIKSGKSQNPKSNTFAYVILGIVLLTALSLILCQVFIMLVRRIKRSQSKHRGHRIEKKRIRQKRSDRDSYRPSRSRYQKRSRTSEVSEEY